MKKIYLTIILGILLIGTIVAVGISIKNEEVSIEEYNKLSSVNSIEVTASPINCNLEYCDIVYIDTGYGHTSYRPKPYWENCKKYEQVERCDEECSMQNGECLEWEKVYYTNEELEVERDNKVEDLKNRIIQRLDLNEEEKETKEEKVKEGKIKYKK